MKFTTSIEDGVISVACGNYGVHAYVTIQENRVQKMAFGGHIDHTRPDGMDDIFTFLEKIKKGKVVRKNGNLESTVRSLMKIYGDTEIVVDGSRWRRGDSFPTTDMTTVNIVEIDGHLFFVVPE